MEHNKQTPQAPEPKKDLVQLANEIRHVGNRMTDEQREAAFNHGMQLIYGGTGNLTAKVRSS